MAVRFPFWNTQQHVDWLAGDYLMRTIAYFLKAVMLPMMHKPEARFWDKNRYYAGPILIAR
jgi:hypothetical protein